MAWNAPLRKLALCAGLALSAAPASAAVTAFAYDWDGAAQSAPGVSYVLGPFTAEAAAGGPYNGSNGKSWSGQHGTRHDTGGMFLNLGNLPAHNFVTIDFLLGFLNSWDSTNGSPAPDILSISIDGGPPVQLTTVTASGSVTNYAGGTLLVDNGQIDGNVFFSDDLVDMGTAGFLSFAHSAATLTLSLQAGGAGFQNFPDEYWGIDALSVVLDGNAVPEPGMLALLGLGLAGLAASRRRRQ
jgi:hypothetical protein